MIGSLELNSVLDLVTQNSTMETECFEASSHPSSLQTRTNDAVVYLDFDNLISNDAPDADGQWIGRLMSFLRSKYRVTLVSSYKDWQKMESWHKTLEGIGVECVHVSSNTRGGKNSADMEATVDVMEMVCIQATLADIASPHASAGSHYWT